MKNLNITKGELDRAIDAAYIEAGDNAYFANGFRFGVNFADSKASELLEQRDMLLKSLRECVRLLDDENEPVYHGFDEEVNRAKEAIQKCQ